MAETPIAVNGQIDIYYTGRTLQHVSQIRCEITNPLAGGGYTIDTPNGSISWTDGVDDYVNVFKPLVPTTGTIDFAVLQLYDAGVYTQLDTYSLGVAGTGAFTPQAGSQLTWTFRDDTNHLTKLVMLEVAVGAPFRLNFGGLSGAAAAFATDLLSLSVGAAGAWTEGRSGSHFKRLVHLTGGFNKKLLRRLNLA